VIPVTKGELVESVAKATDMSKAQSDEAVNAMLDAIGKGLRRDEEVRLVGFGTFSVRERKARNGRNPQTGERIRIEASKTVNFKPGKALKGSL